MEPIVTLEGLHALKHASRFGAQIVTILTDDLDKALTVADTVAPDLRPLLTSRAKVVSQTDFRELATQPVPTHVLAQALAPVWTLAQALPDEHHPTVLLDDPRNSKNLGAVIRVGAAAGAAGLLVKGPADPLSIMAVRGAAGLQWALPCHASTDLLAELGRARPAVERVNAKEEGARPAAKKEDPARPPTGFTLVGLDADGETFDPAAFPGPVVFAFGSERTGLSDEVRAACDRIVSLPMRPQISSLNLATCVSAVLYLRRYSDAGRQDLTLG